jgi:dimeric dUTPase (all-alpha-NTP-PPase superfamily)
MDMETPGTLKLLSSFIHQQLLFQHYYVKKKLGKFLIELTPAERNGILKDMVLAAIGELIEFLEKGTNWKHRAVHPIDRAAALEEFVDAMKYVFNIFIYMQIEEDEFSEAFKRKSKAVLERFFAEFPAEAPVDIGARGGEPDAPSAV